MGTPTEQLEPDLSATVADEQQPRRAGAFDARKAINYSVANFGASVMYALFNTGMPFYLEGYGVPTPLISLLANERSFVGAIIQPIIGRISDRTRSPLGRRRPFFLIGIPLTSLALLLLALHPPFWLMVAVMTVAAFFLAIAWDPYMAMIADLFPAAQRGRVGGFIGVGTGLGNILFYALALLLWTSNQFLVFVLTIIALIVSFGYTFFTVKEEPVELEAEQATLSVKPNPLQYIRDLRQYPEATKYVMFTMLYWIGSGGAVPLVTLFGKHALHLSEAETFYLPLAATAMMALCAVPWGILADRFSKKAALTGGLAIFGVVALIGSQSQNLLQGIIALAFVGVGNSAMTSLINPMLADLIPRKRAAEFIGLGSAVFSFAQPLGSLLVGGVVELGKGIVGENDAYRWAFICAGILVLAAALLLQTVKPERVAYE